MGYSCTVAAAEVLKRLEFAIAQRGVQYENSSNAYIHNGKAYFWEIGKENDDGSITGSIVPMENGANQSFKISPDGQIMRGPKYWSQWLKEADYSNYSKYW